MTSNRSSRRARSATLALLLAACAASATPAQGTWRDLLAGGTAAWRGYKADSLPSGWRYDAATRVLTRAEGGGDIVTRDQFGDFELEIEWRVTAGANSGIFLRANEGTGAIYENATEMQVLDNKGHRDGRNPLTSAGSNFALYAATSDVTKPVGEWNVARVVARGPHVEHWLNGVKVVEYELWSPAWTAAVKGSKFAQWPSYGLGRAGHIGLQDHGDVVSFRNIRIRELGR